jgi:hypothetical protein
MGFIQNWIDQLTPNASSCALLSDIVASHGKKEVGLALEETQGHHGPNYESLKTCFKPYFLMGTHICLPTLLNDVWKNTRL